MYAVHFILKCGPQKNDRCFCNYALSFCGGLSCITSSSSSSVYSLRPNNLVQEEHIYNTYKYKSSEVQTNRYIFIQGKNIHKKEQTIESLLMLDFSIKDHNRKTTKRSRQHQKFLK